MLTLAKYLPKYCRSMLTLAELLSLQLTSASAVIQRVKCPHPTPKVAYPLQGLHLRIVQNEDPPSSQFHCKVSYDFHMMQLSPYNGAIQC
jgi:hypothetical protein